MEVLDGFLLGGETNGHGRDSLLEGGDLGLVVVGLR